MLQDIRPGDIRYDPRRAAFESRVDIVRGGRTYRYPVRVEGPADLDHGQVRARMIRQALAMSDSRFA